MGAVPFVSSFARGRPGRRRRIVLAASWLAIIAVLSVIVLIAALAGNGGTPGMGELKSTVRFDGVQFTVINNDEFAWRNVEFDVNGGLIQEGYAYRPGDVGSSEVVRLGAASFLDAEGRPYNPATEKLRRFKITCDVDDVKALSIRTWN